MTAAIADAPPETLEARNLRLFDREVRPRLVAALGRLALGKGGGVRITGVGADGARVYVEAEIRHGEGHGFTSRLWVGHCMYDLNGNHRETWVMLDAGGTGRFSGFDPRRPIRLRPGSGVAPLDFFRLESLDDLADALDLLPSDPRSRTAQAKLRTGLEETLRRSAGEWVSARDGSLACTVTHRPPRQSDGLPLAFTYPRRESVLARWVCIRPRPDGRVAVFGVDPAGVLILSADGSSVEVPATGEKWVRPPRGRK